MASSRRMTTALGGSASNSRQSPLHSISGDGSCQEDRRILLKTYSTAARVLLLDYDQAHATALTIALEQRKFQVTGCTTKQDTLRELRSHPSGFDVVMLDVSFNRPEDWELFDDVRGLIRENDRLVMVLCFSRVDLGPKPRLQIERKGGRLVYER